MSARVVRRDLPILTRESEIEVQVTIAARVKVGDWLDPDEERLTFAELEKRFHGSHWNGTTLGEIRDAGLDYEEIDDAWYLTLAGVSPRFEHRYEQKRRENGEAVYGVEYVDDHPSILGKEAA